jgi:hypothetical protein
MLDQFVRRYTPFALPKLPVKALVSRGDHKSARYFSLRFLQKSSLMMDPDKFDDSQILFFGISIYTLAHVLYTMLCTLQVIRRAEA